MAVSEYVANTLAWNVFWKHFQVTPEQIELNAPPDLSRTVIFWN